MHDYHNVTLELLTHNHNVILSFATFHHDMNRFEADEYQVESVDAKLMQNSTSDPGNTDSVTADCYVWKSARKHMLDAKPWDYDTWSHNHHDAYIKKCQLWTCDPGDGYPGPDPNRPSHD
jgi:hypothetical protein